MDFGNLFFSAYGRIGRQEFWVGWAILLMVGIFFAFVPFINLILPWGLLYCGICLRSKRLHDMGRTGWWQIIPHVAKLVCLIIVIYLVAAAVLAGVAWHMLIHPAVVAGAVAGAITLVMALFAVWLIDVAFLLWIGIVEPDPYDNTYGPGPANEDYRMAATA